MRHTTIWQKFNDARAAYKKALIERDDEIDLILTALVIRQHVLLVGAPGCAKSFLVDLICTLIGGKKFTRTLSKYSMPDELFGAINIARYKEGHFERITTAKLPECDVAFIDEIFKASSAILNVLLKILNERRFENDGSIIQCPLATCIGASNEWGKGEELGALFDRFLIRKSVRNIATDRGIDRLLWADDLKPAGVDTITQEELAQAHTEALALPVSGEARHAYTQIIKELRREGIVTGDRRLRQSVEAIRGAAWLAGADEVEPDHLEILQHTLWVDPSDQPSLVSEVVGRIANPIGIKINGLLLQADEIISGLDVTDTQSCMTSAKKLETLRKTFKKIDHEKARSGESYVRDELVRIKEKTMEALEIGI